MERVVWGSLVMAAAVGGYLIGGARASHAPVDTSPHPSEHGKLGETLESANDRQTSSAANVEVALLRASLAAHEKERVRCEGTPLAWPANTETKFQEPEYRKTVERARETCAPKADLVLVDCSEYPCIAAFGGAVPELEGCEPWISAYGEKGMLATLNIRCADGHLERALLASPQHPIDGDESLRENAMKRMETRWRNIKDAWTCSPERAMR